MMKAKRVIGATCVLLLAATLASGADRDASITAKYQVTVLFCKERQADFREAMKKVDGVELVSLDYANAEATFRFVPKKVSSDTRAEQIVQALDNKVRAASNYTFGIKPLRTIKREKLKWIEIAVAGCDCKACSLAAYEAIFRLDGVFQATASFREGRVTALIDPTRTDRAKIIAALKKRQVTVKDR